MTLPSATRDAEGGAEWRRLAGLGGQQADADAAWWEHLQSVYVITFIREGEEHAGYYAVRAEGENGEPVDIIVGFADHDDATRCVRYPSISRPFVKPLPTPRATLASMPQPYLSV